MAVDTGNDVGEEADLLARVRQLEDIAAIRKLQYAYCRHMDEGFDADQLGALWVEDGEWDGGPFGRFVGRAAIIAFFQRHGREVAFAAHFLTNEEVTVTGDRATCRCIGLVPTTFRVGEGDEEDQWIMATWDNSFVKVDGRWRFQVLRARVNKSGFHLKGWKGAA
jgi:hypothetical protein